MLSNLLIAIIRVLWSSLVVDFLNTLRKKIIYIAASYLLHLKNVDGISKN